MLRTIKQFINNNSVLAKIIINTQQLSTLTQLFNTILGAELAKHCQLVKIEESELSVSIANSAWATKFKYALPDILKDLKTQPEFKKIKSIRYHLSNSELRKIEEKDKNLLQKKALVLSPKNASLLKVISRSIKNKELKKSLEKLAKAGA